MTIRLIMKVIYILTPGHKRRLLSLVTEMVLQFSLTVTMLHNDEDTVIRVNLFETVK